MSPQAVTTEDVAKESKEKRQLRLVRLRALIQQASEEGGDGQLAAWRACAVIRKFGLDVIDPELVDDLHKEIHTLKQQLEAAKAGDPPDFATPGFQPSHSHFGTHHLWTQTHAPTSSSVNRPPFSSPAGVWSPPAPPQPPAPPPVTGPGGSPMLSPAFIAASKFAGKCKHCRKVINVGDPCQWLKAVGVWCATTSCYSDWFHNQNSAGAFTSPFSTP